MKQIKKTFADGIKSENSEEELKMRRAAYCLTLGISESYLEQH